MRFTNWAGPVLVCALEVHLFGTAAQTKEASRRKQENPGKWNVHDVSGVLKNRACGLQAGSGRIDNADLYPVGPLSPFLAAQKNSRKNNLKNNICWQKQRRKQGRNPGRRSRSQDANRHSGRKQEGFADESKQNCVFVCFCPVVVVVAIFTVVQSSFQETLSLKMFTPRQILSWFIFARRRKSFCHIWQSQRNCRLVCWYWGQDQKSTELRACMKWACGLMCLKKLEASKNLFPFVFIEQ